MEQGRRAATQDNGESQSGRRENIEVTKEDFGRYERNGSKAWCLAIDSRLTETRLARITSVRDQPVP